MAKAGTTIKPGYSHFLRGKFSAATAEHLLSEKILGVGNGSKKHGVAGNASKAKREMAVRCVSSMKMN